MSGISRSVTFNASSSSASTQKQTLKTFSIAQKKKKENVISPAQLQWAKTGIYDISPEVKDAIDKKINKLPKTQEEDARQLKELLEKVR